MPTPAGFTGFLSDTAGQFKDKLAQIPASSNAGKVVSTLATSDTAKALKTGASMIQKAFTEPPKPKAAPVAPELRQFVQQKALPAAKTTLNKYSAIFEEATGMTPKKFYSTALKPIGQGYKASRNVFLREEAEKQAKIDARKQEMRRLGMTSDTAYFSKKSIGENLIDKAKPFIKDYLTSPDISLIGNLLYKKDDRITKPDPEFLAMTPEQQRKERLLYGDEQAMYRRQEERLSLQDKAVREKVFNEYKASLRKGVKAPEKTGKAKDQIGQFWNSLKRGTLNQVVASSFSGIERLGAGFNIKSIEKWAADASDTAKLIVAEHPEWDAPSNLTMHDMEFYSNMIGEGIPIIATMIGTAYLTKGAGMPAAIQEAATLGAMYNITSGATYDQLRAVGVEKGKAIAVSRLNGSVEAALETLPIMRYFNDAPGGKDVSKRLINKISSALVSIGIQAGSEGATEAIQQVASNVIMQDYVENKDVWNGVLENFVGGALLGGLTDISMSAIKSPGLAKAVAVVKANKRGSIEAGALLGMPEGEEAPKNMDNHYWIRTKKIIDDFIKNNPNSKESRLFNQESKSGDLDRAYARALSPDSGNLFSKLPSDLQNEWAIKKAFDQETGETLTLAENDTIRGAHIFNAIKDYESKLDAIELPDTKLIQETKVQKPMTRDEKNFQKAYEAQVKAETELEILKNEGFSRSDIALFNAVAKAKNTLFAGEDIEALYESDKVALRNIPDEYKGKTIGELTAIATERWNEIKQTNLTDTEALEEIMNVPDKDQIAQMTREANQYVPEIPLKPAKVFDTSNYDTKPVATTRAFKKYQKIANDMTFERIDDMELIMSKGEDSRVIGIKNGAGQVHWIPDAKGLREALKNVRKKLVRLESKGYEPQSITARTDYQIQKQSERIQLTSQRRMKLRDLREAYGLSDTEFRRLAPNDVRLMSNEDWLNYYDQVANKAKQYYELRGERQQLINQIKIQEVENLNNLRKLKSMPKMTEMSVPQLEELLSIVEDLEVGDKVFGLKTLENIDKNPDFKGVYTAKKMAEKLKEKGVNLSNMDKMLQPLIGSSNLGDVQLVKYNEIYKFMVEYFWNSYHQHGKKVEELKAVNNDLAKEARASRKRSFAEKFSGVDRYVFNWLNSGEAVREELSKKMTPEELAYAEHTKKLLESIRDYAIENKILKDFKEFYVPHIQRGLSEAISELGFKKGISEWWNAKEELDVKLEGLVDDLNKPITIEQFFGFAEKRGDKVVPTKNVAKIIDSYLNSFYTKVAMDKITPVMTAMIQTMKFLNEEKSPKFEKVITGYINTKLGNRPTRFLNRHSKLAKVLNVISFGLAIKDLGFVVSAQASSLLGEQGAAVSNLGVKAVTKGGFRTLKESFKYLLKLGNKRYAEAQGKSILEKHKTIVKEGIMDELAKASKNLGDKASAVLFSGFHEAGHLTTVQSFLGLLTAEEYKTGIISDERLTEIKLAIGQGRVFEELRSINGKSEEMKHVLMYKKWAASILMNFVTDLELAFRGEGLQGRRESIKRVAQQIIYNGAIAMLVLHLTGGPEDEEGKSAFQQKLDRESLSFFNVFSYKFWLIPRVAQFGKDFLSVAYGLEKLAWAKMTGGEIERYKKDVYDAKKGEIKAINEARRLFTPKLIDEVGKKIGWIEQNPTKPRKPTKEEKAAAFRKKYHPGPIQKAKNKFSNYFGKPKQTKGGFDINKW